MISIHAPARGATKLAFKRNGRWEISIHAPARGATYEELDQFAGDSISIHAPARGATSMNTRDVIDNQFQSTLPRGERLMDIKDAHKVIEFQSTLPRGERLVRG